jgi:hypothetical protein
MSPAIESHKGCDVVGHNIELCLVRFKGRILPTGSCPERSEGQTASFNGNISPILSMSLGKAASQSSIANRSVPRLTNSAASGCLVPASNILHKGVVSPSSAAAA